MCPETCYVSFEQAKELKKSGLKQGISKMKYAEIKRNGYLEILPQGVLIRTIDVDYYDAPNFAELCDMVLEKYGIK